MIPKSVTSIGMRVFHECENLEEIIVDDNNPVFSHIDGVLFNKTGQILHTYPSGKTRSWYRIPEGTKSIGIGAFSRCSSLIYIAIPNSVTSIEDFAFQNCTSLTEITIPESVTSIGSAIIVGSENFVRFAVSKNNPVYAHIGGVLFNKIDKSIHAYPIAKKDSVYTIPEGIITIGDLAFYQCSYLTEIMIPSTVKSIEEGAFAECTSLSVLRIPNSVNTIGDFAFAWCSSLISATIPNSVTSIGEEAFLSCENLSEIRVTEESYAFNHLMDTDVAYALVYTPSWL